MIWRTIPLIVILCLTIPASGQGRMDNDIKQLGAIFKPKSEDVTVKRSVDYKNEITLLLSAAYNFYKAFLSSQDALNCAFYPSCSTYAIETIRTNGLLGIFDAIDRLTRCNGFSPEKYTKHKDSPHFHDPVKKIL